MNNHGIMQGTYRGEVYEYIDDYTAFYRDANDNNLLDPQDQLLWRVDFGGDFGGLGNYGAMISR